MKTNAPTLIAPIVALACFLPFSAALAATLVYKGAVVVVGEQTSENHGNLDSPTKMKIRKKFGSSLL